MRLKLRTDGTGKGCVRVGVGVRGSCGGRETEHDFGLISAPSRLVDLFTHAVHDAAPHLCLLLHTRVSSARTGGRS